MVALSAVLGTVTACRTKNASQQESGRDQEIDTPIMSEQFQAATQETTQESIVKELPQDWVNQEIPGREFIPTDEELKRIEQTVPNQKMQESDFLDLKQDDIAFIGKTDGFTLWGTHCTDAMIVKTPDQKYIWINAPYLSPHMQFPKIKETDLDGDGQNELTIHTFVLYGTGYLEELIAVVDQNHEEWLAYQLTPNWYMQQLNERVTTRVEDKKAVLVLDGRDTNLFMEHEGDFSHFDLEAWIKLSVDEDKILMSNVPVGYCEKNPTGYYSDDILQIEVEYRGNGVWNLGNIEIQKQ